MSSVVVTLSCEDRPGIVASVAGFLTDRGFSIRSSQQFGDEETGLFFMRVHAATEETVDLTHLRTQFRSITEPMAMDAAMHDHDEPHRLLVMVSKQGHCLNDLLHRARTGSLPAQIAAVVSNHDDLRGLVEWHGIPYHHVPVGPKTKAAAEEELLKLVATYDADTVVLARYMQILSDRLCQELRGRAINIHHSLLPSFKGARPYFQAHARGVKVVGATAHYVTADLDEGPIIEQEFARVHHSDSVADLTEIGKDLEALALARGVSAHAEHRVIINGGKTVVFRR
ncbi:formyltetrahydrofolate deformylase [Streptomyces sp. Inha503]|uniref:formyltetrahydrofolate deformylase n=1 Tax=Streptomyces sp. Inha503 TaxID=3383314 RepID=UPI00399FCD7E